MRFAQRVTFRPCAIFQQDNFDIKQCQAWCLLPWLKGAHFFIQWGLFDLFLMSADVNQTSACNKTTIKTCNTHAADPDMLCTSQGHDSGV